jgi:phosphoglycolate phosphatase-like HAD superfamily hydrolase
MPIADSATSSVSTTDQATQQTLLIRDGFLWDNQDAYLFDIDGTLLRSRDRIHFNAFAASIREVTGLSVTLDGVLLHGGTDTAILAEAFALAGHAPEVWEPHNEAILEAMRRIVLSRRSEMQIWTMPAVRETLAYLAARGALLGIATGNLEQIGWAKVEEAGLRSWFHFGGFSDRFRVRSEMVADAAAQARALLPRIDSPSICVVGDTPRDIEAAHANQLPVIAVATGNYSFAELSALHPEVCALSLAELLAPKTSEARP